MSNTSLKCSDVKAPGCTMSSNWSETTQMELCANSVMPLGNSSPGRMWGGRFSDLATCVSVRALPRASFQRLATTGEFTQLHQRQCSSSPPLDIISWRLVLARSPTDQLGLSDVPPLAGLCNNILSYNMKNSNHVRRPMCGCVASSIAILNTPTCRKWRTQVRRTG